MWYKFGFVCAHLCLLIYLFINVYIILCNFLIISLDPPHTTTKSFCCFVLLLSCYFIKYNSKPCLTEARSFGDPKGLQQQSKKAAAHRHRLLHRHNYPSFLDMIGLKMCCVLMKNIIKQSDLLKSLISKIVENGYIDVRILIIEKINGQLWIKRCNVVTNTKAFVTICYHDHKYFVITISTQCLVLG